MEEWGPDSDNTHVSRYTTTSIYLAYLLRWILVIGAEVGMSGERGDPELDQPCINTITERVG